jgi:hypothetical protein
MYSHMYITLQLDTNRQLEWLKSVKQAHGSVEVTSLSQSKAINSKGIYCVGRVKNEARTPPAEGTLGGVISLHVVEDDDECTHIRRQYTYGQLQDLQSRLMLVAGKAEQGKDEVNRFIMVSVEVNRFIMVSVEVNRFIMVSVEVNWQARFTMVRHVKKG